MVARCIICHQEFADEVKYPDHTMHMACVLAATAHVRMIDLRKRACRMALERRRAAHRRRMMMFLLND